MKQSPSEYLLRAVMKLLLISILTLPIVVSLLGYSLKVFILFTMLLVLGYGLGLYSNYKTNIHLTQEEEVLIFMQSSILKLQQGQNYINALKDSSLAMKSKLKTDALVLIDELINDVRPEIALSNFSEKHKGFVVQNFSFLLLVTIKYSATSLSLMYDEFLSDVKVIQQQKIKLDKKVKGFSVGLKGIIIFIIFTTFMMISSLNVGVFSEVSKTSEYQQILLNFLVVLYIVYISIEWYLNSVLRSDFR